MISRYIDGYGMMFDDVLVGGFKPFFIVHHIWDNPSH